MKELTTIIILFFTITLASCNNNQNGRNETQQTPKALQSESSLGEMKSFSRGEDLVDNLYKELTDKNPDLKKLEEEIKDLRKSQSDSSESFNTFNGKIQSYYSSANNYSGQIKDSLLREKVTFLISTSLKEYNSQIAAHLTLLADINRKTITLNDLHNVLMITRTLPVIEKYQDVSRPRIMHLKGFEQKLNNTLKHADSLVQK